MPKRISALLLCFSLVFCLVTALTGCGSTSTDLMRGFSPAAVDTPADPDMTAAADFSLRLFRECADENRNTLLSPVSVLCALAMTANGARGDTLAQMEEIFGVSSGELNRCLHAYIFSLPEGEKYKLSLANSIWFRDSGDLSVQESFLQTNADYYEAGIFKAPLDDSTVREMNDWVNDKTDGMINRILDSIDPGTEMYLLNALSFDAEWRSVYKESQVRDGVFTAQDGSEQTAAFMHSIEYEYLEDDSASGFVKYYADGKYAFAALLPNEGVSIGDYINELTGEHLAEVFDSAQNFEVDAAIPKFDTEYGVLLNDILYSMGMTDAFDAASADFSGIGVSGKGRLYIGQVVHKTHITVDEKGTKAGAVTMVSAPASAPMPVETKTVHLDRPFVYMIIDCETFLPVFIGTLMTTA